MRLIFLLLFTISVVAACTKQEPIPEVLLEFGLPVSGQLIQDDTLFFTVHLRTNVPGLVKMSLVNENGVSILNPKVFDGVISDTTIRGYFLVDKLEYYGNASLVALWLGGGVQAKKTARVLLASGMVYHDAFILFRSQPSGFRLIHLMDNGSIRAEVQNLAFDAVDAVWSAPAQTLAMLHPNRRSVIAIKYPFSSAEYTLHALITPHEFIWLSADGNRFWLGEKGGNVRAVRASDGHSLVTFSCGHNCLPYAISHSSQYSSVSYLLGANKHFIRLFYRQTGVLHSEWPMTGRVVDAAWKNEQVLNVAVRNTSGIALYEVWTDPPSLKFLRNLTAHANDSLFFVPGEAYLLRSGFSITQYNLSGQMNWHKVLPSIPRYFAISPNTYWVRYDSYFLQISREGHYSRILVLPENPFTGECFSAIFAPVKEQR